jgi:hypothetical protein
MLLTVCSHMHACTISDTFMHRYHRKLPHYRHVTIYHHSSFQGTHIFQAPRFPSAVLCCVAEELLKLPTTGVQCGLHAGKWSSNDIFDHIVRCFEHMAIFRMKCESNKIPSRLPKRGRIWGNNINLGHHPVPAENGVPTANCRQIKHAGIDAQVPYQCGQVSICNT